MVIVVPPPPLSRFPLGADHLSFVLSYFLLFISVCWVHFQVFFSVLDSTLGLCYIYPNCIVARHLSCRMLLYTHALTFRYSIFSRLHTVYRTPLTVDVDVVFFFMWGCHVLGNIII